MIPTTVNLTVRSSGLVCQYCPRVELVIIGIVIGGAATILAILIFGLFYGDK